MILVDCTAKEGDFRVPSTATAENAGKGKSQSSTVLQPGAAAVFQCSTALLTALAATFASFSLLVLVFLCLRLPSLLRSRARSGAQIPQSGQAQQEPKRGLDAAAIALLPRFPYRRDCPASASPDCAVCLGVVDEGEIVRQLPGCMHLFHQGCIDVWLLFSASWPVCRGDPEAPPAARHQLRAAASALVVPVEVPAGETVASLSTSGAVHVNY